MKTVEIYTDGACSGNPGRRGNRFGDSKSGCAGRASKGEPVPPWGPLLVSDGIS